MAISTKSPADILTNLHFTPAERFVIALIFSIAKHDWVDWHIILSRYDTHPHAAQELDTLLNACRRKGALAYTGVLPAC